MKRSQAIAVALILSMPVPAALAEDPYHPKMTTCEIVYNLKGWSVIYKTSKGEGHITCGNGQAADVAIETHGGGLTVGKSEIIGGKGKFSQVRSIDDLFGTYAVAEAHAGATKSAGAQAMTKGEVSLSLAGTGQGIDLGFSFGGFTIERK
jgi:hypothetical protein